MRAAMPFALLLSGLGVGAESILENDRLAVRIDPDAGRFSVADKLAGYTYTQAIPARPQGAPRFRGLQGAEHRIAFEVDLGARGAGLDTVKVTLELRGADLAIEIDAARRDSPMAGFAFPEALVLDTPAAVLAVSDYCNGHLYPLDCAPFPKTWFDADRLDMPWVGLCDLARGFGYALILETSDDAAVQMTACRRAGRELAAPRVFWRPSMDAFGAPRKLIYRFVHRGSHVALAKAYREYAAGQGLLVTLARKTAANPNVARLFGAPDVWGGAGLAFAREAKAAGVEKMLINGRASAEDIRAINALGYLTGEYDNYTDILPLESGRGIDARHDELPGAAVLKADGERMTAWLTWDKQTQYMKRCPALWERAARAVIPKALSEIPFLARFIDVTTAEALYECRDPEHPLTRADKRRRGETLLAYVRSLGLVAGGEHGVWWGVPHLDYIEGMMSGGWYSWPAGHLIHPKSKTDSFTSPWGERHAEWSAYERWGIGHAWRAPLWELVFHDCIVSTWYWGDASDWLREAAPEIADKKDAFNILYGTIPLLWADREGSWHADRARFLRAYRVTCPLHEAIAGAEMLAHEFLDAKHDVQRTIFSDGTEVIVNFGAEPYPLRRSGQTLVLPTNGFAVEGPRIRQHRVLENGRAVTAIAGEGFWYFEGDGVEYCARAEGAEKLRVNTQPCAAPLRLELHRFAPAWDPAVVRAYSLDAAGERAAAAPCRRDGEALLLGPFATAARLELLCGKAAALPDLVVERVVVDPPAAAQGAPVTATAFLRNIGAAPADGIALEFFADAMAPERLLASHTLALASGEERAVSQRIDSGPLDGERRIAAAVNRTGAVRELCTQNNAAEAALAVAPDARRWRFVLERALAAEAIPWRGLPVAVPCPEEIDPASARADGLPAQAIAGAVLVLLGGPGPAPARIVLRCNPSESPARLFPPPATMWRSATSTIAAETYGARFENGVLVDLAALEGGAAAAPFISKLIVSSRETGWTEEPGGVEEFRVLEAGPVRTVIMVKKRLEAGIAYEKRYEFYPRFFEVEIALPKGFRCAPSRAHYLRAGEFATDAGARATVDGAGDGEGVNGAVARWYAVRAPSWAHSCTLLGDAGSLTYWDARDWGGIGFNSRAEGKMRLRYAIHPGGADAQFARDDAREVEAALR